MAIDGVKIIDSDQAHNVYGLFMASYDAGRPLGEIQATIETLQAGNDDVDDELFITAYALALWEVGALTDAIRQRAAVAIAAGAFSRFLTENAGRPAAGRQRQQVLHRFWAKISQPNPNVRKRKPRKRQPAKKLLFSVGEVLAFQLPDGSYRSTVLLEATEARGKLRYQFARITYLEPTKPTLADVQASEVLGRTFEPPAFPEHRIGFDMVDVEHRHLRAFAGSFELIGRLELGPAAQQCGHQYGALTFAEFAHWFRDFNNIIDIKKTARTHPRQVFPVQKLL
jgi:hypothetical protein